MKFGAVPLAEAEGGILAHSLTLPGAGGKKGRVFKKGRVLSAEDARAIEAAGLERVVVARLESGDVGEDQAAAAVARAAGGENLRLSGAFTGRVNLFAQAWGLAVIDAGRLDRLNRADESVAVATLPPYELVEPGQMVATVKVIPFAIRRKVLAQCAAIAGEGGPLIRVAAFKPKAVGLIQTRLPGMKESLLDKTVQVLSGRLEALGSRLTSEIRCAHDAGEIADAVKALCEAGAQMVLVSGASAIVDRRDVVPAGIERAGGSVDHFGMPVDPGNLLLLAHHGPTPVVGLPGCVRSPKFNGFDPILRRLVADLPVTSRDIMGMGAGGLLTEIPSRPLPRAEAAPILERGEAATAKAPRMARIAAVVLAAGQSRRMGRGNKLLAEIDGVPMIVRVVDAALASRAEPVVVVTGHQADQVRAALGRRRRVAFVHNPDYAAGLSSSLERGLAALKPDVDGALICLGDMPQVAKVHLNRLIDAFNPLEGRAICVPTTGGKRGNPVLWARRFFADMMRTSGDVGARHLIGENAELVSEVEMADEGVLIDIDSPQALTALKRAKSG